MRIVVLVALAAFLVPAWATNTNTQVTLAQISARAVEAKYGRADQAWRDLSHLLDGRHAATSPTGSVLVTTTHKGPSPIVGEVIDIDVKRKLPWASISKAVAKSLPLISTAVAIAEIAEAIRCREATGGGSECDAGTDEVEKIAYPYNASSSFGGSNSCTGAASHSAAANCVLGKLNSTGYGDSGSTTVVWNSVSLLSGDASSQYWNLSKTTCTTYTNPPSTECNTTTHVNGIQTVRGAAVPQLACPDVVVNGVTLTPVKGADGKCMTNIYEPASDEQVATKVEDHGNRAKAPQLVGELLSAGKPIEHPFPEIDPVPGSINGPRETTTHPDGSTTTRDTRWDLVPKPNGYEWVPSIVTKDWPPGVTPDPPGSVSDGTTTSGGASPERDIITCGLPDTPACKIDETGTPTSGSFGTAEGELAEKRGELVGALGEAAHARTSLPWSWMLDFPVGSCTPFVWDTRLGTLTIDPCSSAGVDLWRALCAWLLFALTGLHIWRSVNEALSG